MAYPEPDDIEIPFGGSVTLLDFILFPALGMFSALAMVPILPTGLAWVIVAVGTLISIGLILTATIGFVDERAWIEGSRIQIPLILGSFVVSQVVTFASTYYLMSMGAKITFSERLGPAAALYFSTTTWTTAGLGDIRPMSSPARLLVALELLLAAATVLVILSTAVTKAFTRRG